MNLWFSLVISSALKSTVVLIFAWVLALLARNRSAAFRHQIWKAAIVCVLVLPVIQSASPQWHARALPDPLWRKIFQASAPAQHQPPASRLSVDAVNDSSLPWKPLLLGVWAAGVFVFLLRTGNSLRRLGQLSASSRPVADRVLLAELDRVYQDVGLHQRIRLVANDLPQVMPCTWGFRRPAVLLPATASGWTPQRSRLVLLHELAHVRRRDWVYGLIAEFARALYWFHPLVWLAVRGMREESERACDDTVLAGGVEASLYASELLQLLPLNQPFIPGRAALAIAHPSTLERRFTAMFDVSLDRRSLAPKTTTWITLGALLLLTPLAALRAPALESGRKFTGVVTDSNGASLARATIILRSQTLHSQGMTATALDGSYHFDALAPGEYQMRVMKPGFAEYRDAKLILEPGGDFARNVVLEPETAAPAPDPSPRVRLAGNVESARLVRKVAPRYPQSARKNGIQGVVFLQAVIDQQGVPVALMVANEVDPDLARSAVESVSQWRYTPVLLNGEPVEVSTMITVNYTLAR